MALAVLARTNPILPEKELVSGFVGPGVGSVGELYELLARLDRVTVGVAATVLVVPGVDQNEGG